MCNKYEPVQYELWPIMGVEAPVQPYKLALGPWGHGPFIRPVEGRLQAFVGQWAMVAPGAREAAPRSRVPMTNNARLETIDEKKTFSGPWARGQRCLIPARSYDEPRYDDGRTNVWWRMRPRNAPYWMMAGIWSEWIDPRTGEVLPNFSMVTVNCDTHPLLRLMHKPDTSRPEHMQDKRAVVALSADRWEAWLFGPVDRAKALCTLPDEGEFDAGPALMPAKPEH